ncbi:MAG TPA: TolC family protein [Puia sp.]|nr:TolC family protein [Puia sp.]
MAKSNHWSCKMSFWAVALYLLCLPSPAHTQQAMHLSIQQAYQLAKSNYPLIKQKDLIRKTTQYSVANAAKGYLPVFNINGQATYQSDVTNFPFKIPGLTVPGYSKDQYKIYGEVDQVMYDGGNIKTQKQSAEINDAIQQQNLEVQLYAVFDRVNQLYFGCLLAEEQLKQNELLKKDIQNGLDKVKAMVANGTAYRSSADELSAQLLQADQSRVELQAIYKSYMNMLALFVNLPLDENTVIEKPEPVAANDTVSRPELLLYDFQKRNYDVQDKMLDVQLRPKFNLFLQGGYARPGLNMLSNNFQWYYIGGIRMNWNLGSLYTLKNQRQLLNINRQTLDIQKETFLFNTKITQKQESEDILKYTGLMSKDDAIISLRESVKNAANAQLENGVLSAHDYLTQVNAEDQARQNLILHQIQLLQAQYNYQNTTGNIKTP